MDSAASRANQALRSIWARRIASGSWPAAIPKLWPLQYVEMEPGRIVFVGINPSHKECNTAKLRIGRDFECELNSTERLAEVLEYERAVLGLTGKTLHPYFKEFSKFSPDGTWNHLDILAVRCTNQSTVRHALQLEPEKPAANEFVREQLDVFQSLLSEIAPAAVVVVNALASSLFIRQFGITAGPSASNGGPLDEEAGHNWGTFGGRRVPLFFSGMLTGQRALDGHSRERLIWHVRRALSRISTN
ncbi:MAG: hypothetical protein ACTHN5_03205 [Phycisphaerae bacterium]